MAAGKELKIGIVVVAAILLFVFGLNFLIGKRVFSLENEFYAYYSNVQGLQESAEVQVSGLNVGRVASIELQPDRRVKVVFTTRKNLKIPMGSTAELASADLISGTKVIKLNLSDGEKLHKGGDLIPSSDFAGILESFSDKVDPLLGSTHHAMTTVDTLIGSLNNVINPSTQAHLSNALASLDQTLSEFKELSKNLNEQSKDLAEVMKNVNSFTGNLKESNQKVTDAIANLEKISAQLSNGQLDETLAGLKATSENLKAITSKIDANQGSLGMMLNDKELYNNMTKTLSSLDIVLEDLKKNPAKYINVSVFGRKVEVEETPSK